MSNRITLFAAVLLTSAIASPLIAQTQPKPDGNTDSYTTGDTAERIVLALRAPNLQQELGLNDADFNTLLPKIARIDRAVSFYGAVGMIHHLPPGTGPAARGIVVRPWRENPNLPPVEYARRDLDELLHDPNAPDNVIAAKLKVFRDARAKALADLQLARENLRAVLTVRQEAVMVSHGFLN